MGYMSGYKKASVAARRAAGFSIVELMVTVTVAAVLLGLAIPSFRDLIRNNHVVETTNQLVGDLNLARSEAVRRGTLVAVISTSGGNDWSTGWYVESDGDFKGDGTFMGNPPPTTSKDFLLRTNAGVDTTANYKITTKVTTAACTSAVAVSDGMVIFNAQGNLTCKAGAFDINVCRPDSLPTKSKRITVSLAGMLSTQTDTSSSPAPGC
jgi:type IV fimbrial biogenesis protein FimT